MDRLLSAAGFCAETFASAEDLLENGRADTAACLILDVNLPGLSGFDLNQRLRRSGCQTLAIFITAYDEPEYRTRAQVECAVDYFVKPFPAQTLLAAIARAIDLGKLQTNS